MATAITAPAITKQPAATMTAFPIIFDMGKGYQTAELLQTKRGPGGCSKDAANVEFLVPFSFHTIANPHSAWKAAADDLHADAIPVFVPDPKVGKLQEGRTGPTDAGKLTL